MPRTTIGSFPAHYFGIETSPAGAGRRMLRHLFLVGYDIACPNRRRRVLRALKGHAIGGQKSLYECWLTSGELQATMHEVRQLIDASDDRVMFVRLDPRSVVYVRGVAVPPDDGELFYVG